MKRQVSWLHEAAPERFHELKLCLILAVHRWMPATGREVERLFYAHSMHSPTCPRCAALADEVVRLRSTLSFYRWWLWEVGQAL